MTRITVEGREEQNMLSSEVAIRSLSAGAPPAHLPELEQLVSREYRTFTRRAARYLDNSHDAEDAVQDALLSAYQHLSTFKNQSKLSTWLTTIVINAARAQRRRRKPGFSYEQLLEAVERPALIVKLSQDKRPSPEEIHGRNEVSHLLLAFVDQLSPIYRRAVYLFYFYGLNTADASDALGIPVPTFKAQLGRARKQLRQRIQESVNLRSRKAPFDASV
jgi:RNA polymerase sigma-70 factor, ECF subfamily